MTSSFRNRIPTRASVLASTAIVMITTTGALIGLGRREGEAARVFRLVGLHLLTVAYPSLMNAPGTLSRDAWIVATALGYLHHLLISAVWGLLLSLLVLRFRGFTRVAACLLVIPLYVMIVPRFVTPLLRIGHAVTSNDARVFPVAAALAFGLLGGAWVASGEEKR